MKEDLLMTKQFELFVTVFLNEIAKDPIDAALDRAREELDEMGLVDALPVSARKAERNEEETTIDAMNDQTHYAITVEGADLDDYTDCLMAETEPDPFDN